MAEIVFLTGAPPFPFGATGFDDPFSFPLYSGLDPQVLSGHEDRAMVLLASPFDPNAMREFLAPPFPFGEADINGPFQFSVGGTRDLQYIAHTHGLTTLPEDTPPNKYLQGAFSKTPNIGSSVFKGADPTQPSESSVGVITLDDPNGDLDYLETMSWDGADIEIRRGPIDGLISSYASIAKLSGAGILGDGYTKEIRLRDNSWKLSQVQLHGQLFLGTGGLEGNSTLVGKVKPYAVGYNFNITPVLLDSIQLTYLCSFTSINSILELRHAAVPWDNAGDVATFEELEAAIPPPASYITCLARGAFKLGSTPTSDVTCDVIGDNDTISDQAPPLTRAQIVRRIATRMGTYRLDEASQIDFNALTYLDQRQPAPVGFYWTDPVTKDQAINRVLKGCLGWWVMTVTGVLIMGLTEDPETGSPTLVLSFPFEGETASSRLGELRQTDQLPPRRATYIAWRTNNTIQQPSSIAGSVAMADVQIYGAAGRYASIQNQWIINNYPSSPDVFVEDSGYWYEEDAALECQRQGDLFSKPRNRYAVQAAIDPLVNVIGQRARIDNYYRQNFGAQKRLFCCGIDATNDSSVDLHFWG